MNLNLGVKDRFSLLMALLLMSAIVGGACHHVESSHEMTSYEFSTQDVISAQQHNHSNCPLDHSDDHLGHLCACVCHVPVSLHDEGSLELSGSYFKTVCFNERLEMPGHSRRLECPPALA